MPEAKKASMLDAKIEFEHVHESNMRHGKSENNKFAMQI